MIPLLKALLLLLLVALNAFFVAAEYSLIRIRRTRLEQMIAEGNKPAQLIRTLLADTGLLFSGIQLGITVASLLMGWLGERITAEAIERLLQGHLHPYASLAIAHSIATGVAFVFVTVLLMVLGELVPKTFAYERAERVALTVARPMTLYFRMVRLPVKLLGNLSLGLMRALGARPTGPARQIHTPDEVKLIVSAIREGGLLEEEQEEMIHGVFELDTVHVRAIMVPWPRVATLPVTGSLGEILERVVVDQHTRVPVYDESPDEIVGILHTKDLLALFLERQRRGFASDDSFDLRSLLHQPLIVPETMTLNQMLQEFRPRRAQAALVVDEFGTFVGLVTLEDVLEEIVGEISDEYDREERPIERVSENVLMVDGALGLRELADDYGIELPRDAGYETVAGFVLDRLGAVPQGGETFVFGDRHYTVMKMEGRRVASVRVEKLPPAPQPGAPTASGTAGRGAV
ncbi:MAG TPA: hemolysin family protein [Terriglobia bacterium]|nr:hemolysin family protein [Terriglobia bacterium]